MQPAALTAEPTPLFSRLEGLNLEKLVPQNLIHKHLMGVGQSF
jgi:hypothetical protein